MGLYDFMPEGSVQPRKNELHVYKPGEIQRRELPDFATCSDSTAIINGYIAMWLASMLVNILEDSNGYLMELGARLDCVTLKNNSREACFQIHLKGTADMQFSLDMNYTYNEMAYKYIREEIEDGTHLWIKNVI